tara:strand:+ start:548 stop:781 length:234 start_codon:yes stop_codon:yes gene_type:complete
MDNKFFENNIQFAMLNSYDVIVNNVPVEDILATTMPFIAHNPFAEPRIEDMMGMLEYFEEQEDYEKCIKIKKIIDEI